MSRRFCVPLSDRELLEQEVRLGIEHAMALLNRGLRQRQRQVTLARTGWTDEQEIFALRDEAAGRELERQRAAHLLVEGEIEGVQRATRVAEARLDGPPFEQSILSPLRFIIDEHGDELERRQPLGLRMAWARLEYVSHAREPELTDGAIQFGDVQEAAARCSMRARKSVRWRMSGSICLSAVAGSFTRSR